MNRAAKTYRGWSFLYSPRWLGYYAMLLVFAIACVLLSNWQFARRDEARAEIARIDRNYSAEPLPLAQALPKPTHFDESTLKWHPVTATGQYIGEPVLVRNRPGEGGSGSIIMQAFRTENGRVVFIDRGWVDVTAEDLESGSFNFSSLPLAPTGVKTTVTARLKASEPQVQGRSSTAHTVGSVHVPELARLAQVQKKLTVCSDAYGVLMKESAGFDHATLPDKPERDEGPHFSYALQWLVFIVIAAVGVGYAARTEFKNFNRGSERVRQIEAKREARRRRKGPTDADEEDALIDEHTRSTRG